MDGMFFISGQRRDIYFFVNLLEITHLDKTYNVYFFKNKLTSPKNTTDSLLFKLFF